jgi:predicted metalloprotease with PDZ domain
MSKSLLFSIAALLVSTSVPAQKLQESMPILIRIDLTDAPRRLIHVTERLPVHFGDNVFAYPKWIPGRERPDGPIDNLTGFAFHAGTSEGATVTWRQDLSDSYKFHVQVPRGVTSLAASYDLLEVRSHMQTEGSKHTSLHVVVVEPSDVVLYPADQPVHDTPISTTLHLPTNWKAATALRNPGSSESALNGPDTTFQTVSVEQLIDSPILAGDHCRIYPLAPAIHPSHTLDICTDKEADLNQQPGFLAKMSTLVEQASKVFIGHHYDHYDFLVAASQHLSWEGTEHTQSSDNIVFSVDTSKQPMAANLAAILSHEFTHSWCGKISPPRRNSYRRLYTAHAGRPHLGLRRLYPVLRRCSCRTSGLAHPC